MGNFEAARSSCAIALADGQFGSLPSFCFFFEFSVDLLGQLELVQPHMTQKPVLRGEVDARALRV